MENEIKFFYCTNHHIKNNQIRADSYVTFIIKQSSLCFFSKSLEPHIDSNVAISIVLNNHTVSFNLTVYLFFFE
jgi:hypothetical protein